MANRNYKETKAQLAEKTDLALATWDNLSSDKKDKVYKMVKDWPEILAKSNFKIERLKFLCYCETKL